jgi:hypothetical protein
MATENQDVVSTFAAVVEGKIKALQALLDSLKSAVAMGAFGSGEGLDLAVSGASSNALDMTPIDLPEGAFNGKSLPACVKLYLSAAKRKKTIKEIAAALREGGVESTSDNFENVVTGALFRLKTNGDVLRFKDGWGLSEWYPANMRGSVGAPTKNSKAKKKGKKARTKTSPAMKTTKGEPQNVTEIAKPEDKPEPRILGFFKTNQREIPAREVATALGLKIQTVNLVLSKLAHQNKIQRLQSGNFRALGTAAS